MAKLIHTSASKCKTSECGLFPPRKNVLLFSHLQYLFVYIIDTILGHTYILLPYKATDLGRFHALPDFYHHG